MNIAEVEQRFKQVLEQHGLLKQAAALDLSADDDDSPLKGAGTTEVEETTEGDPARVRAEKAPPPKAVTTINLFQHPDTHPYVLDLALLQKYGPEWMEWEVETIALRVPQDFPTRSVSALNMEKLQAVRTLHYVNTFWLDWDVFLPCTMAFNGLLPDFEVMQVPTVAQCAVAVDLANRIRQDVEWSDEVKMYLAAVHQFDGILCPIDPLEFVEVDTEGLPIDCEEIRGLWPEVRRTGRVPSEESVTAEQLRRMLIVQNALREDRAQLQAQLPLLLNG